MSDRETAIAFDLDGVLVDSYHVWHKVLNAALQQFGHPPISEPDFRPHWGQGIDDDLRSFFPERTREEVEVSYGKHFPRFAAEVRVLPGAREAVALLRARNARLAVVTNSPQAVAETLLKRAQLLDAFDAIVTASDVAYPKPAPDMIHAAAERLGVAVAELIVIGDSEFDRVAAEGAGARFIPFHSFDELELPIH